MKTSVLIFGIVLLMNHRGEGQELSLLVKGGASYYNALSIGTVGTGNSRDDRWKTGPIIGAGVRSHTSGSFSFDALVEYSRHHYRTPSWRVEPQGDPTMSIVEASVIGRSTFPMTTMVRWGILYGLGVSYQSQDLVVFKENDDILILSEGEILSMNGSLGITLDARMSDGVEVSLEGSLQAMHYVTPVLQLGITYQLFRQQSGERVQ